MHNDIQDLDTREAGGRSFSYRELLVPLLAAFAVYACTISHNLVEAHDSVGYINAIDAGRHLFHPHHLLYNALGFVWLSGWRAVGVAADSATVVTMLNVVFGALGLCVFYMLLRTRLSLSRPASLAGTALPAVSFGFWFYSVCIEVYIIPVFFLLLSLYVITAKPLRAGTFALVGLTHGLAVLFHQVHVLFAPVVLAAALLRYRGDLRGLARACAAYALVAVPTVVVPYLLVMTVVLDTSTVGQGLHWLTSYTRSERFWYPLALSTALKGVIGSGRTLVGGHFLFAIPQAAAFVRKMLPEHSLVDEEFMVRNMSRAGAVAVCVPAVGFALGFLAGLVMSVARWRRFSPGARSVLLLVLVWLVPYCVFFFFWEPSNLEMRIPQLLCLWLVFMMGWTVKGRPGHKRRGIVALCALAGLGLAANFPGSIWPAHEQSNDYYYAKTSGLEGMARPGDLVVAPRCWMWREYVGRYSGADVLGLASVYDDMGSRAAFIRCVRDAVDRRLAGGHGVYLLEEAVAPGPETLSGSQMTAAAVSELWRIYKDSWRPVRSGVSTVYVLPGEPSDGIPPGGQTGEGASEQ